ncbi:MAG: hypothetical protein WD749_01235 [Phycisphaerales bacterium]
MMFWKVAAVAAVALASTTQAAVTKLTQFYTSSEEVGDVDGMAVLKYMVDQDRTKANVVLHDLTPGQTYSYFVGNGFGGFGMVTANPAGNATFSVEFNGDGTNPDFGPTMVFLHVDGDFRVATNPLLVQD